MGMGGVATNNSVLGVRESVVYCPYYHEHLLLCVQVLMRPLSFSW